MKSNEIAAERKLAEDIVASWKKNRSNIIVIAPPLTRARVLFALISNEGFLERILGEDAKTTRVSKIGTIDFKSDSSFVDGALRGWGVSLDAKLKALDPVERLEEGLRFVLSAGFSPILIINRFHEALKKLGEDIGTALRNLEHEHGLRTVVELPVSLQTLRDRWELSGKNPVPFLASDWGQGHPHKLLRGYSQAEISSVLGLTTSDSDIKISTLIYDATGGLPDLFDLVADDIRGKSLNAVEQILRGRSLGGCRRLLDWLDKPGESLFKRIFATAAHITAVQERGMSPSDHDWHQMFAQCSSGIRPLMLGWAASADLMKTRNPGFLQTILELINQREYVTAVSLLEAPDCEDVDPEIWNVLRLVLEFAAASDPFDPSWPNLDRCLKSLEVASGQQVATAAASRASALQDWRSLVSSMLRYGEVQAKDSRIRLEEHILRRCDSNEIESYIQLLRLRLDAAKLMSAYMSVKSIVEQPESIIQVYAYLRHKIKYWSFEGERQGESAEISRIFKKPYTLPTAGSKLGFVDLLYLCVSRESEAGDLRGLSSIERAQVHERLYDLRKTQVHSTAFVSSADATSYQAWCNDWLNLLADQSRMTTGKIALPRASAIAASLLER